MKTIFALALLLGLGMMVGCGPEAEAGRLAARSRSVGCQDRRDAAPWLRPRRENEVIVPLAGEQDCRGRAFFGTAFPLLFLSPGFLA